MRQTTFALTLVAAVLAVTLTSSIAGAHERKEVAGLHVLFGAEPEPALTEEVESLRWRFTSEGSDEPFNDIEDATAVITRHGKEFGPFETRRSRNEPGLRQTRHIFTEAGDYEVVLTFKKTGDPTAHTIAFTYTIRDRGDLRIP